jgi:hypothetical protein
MSQSEKIELAGSPHDEAEALTVKQTFCSLIDAMKFAQRLGQVTNKIGEMELQGRNRSEALDQLSNDIASLVARSKEVLGEENTVELSKQIISFSSLAIEQTKRRVAEQSANEHKELLTEEDSEKTKTFKTIEALLATSPFQIHDKVLSLRFSDGAYDSKCRYVCEESIEYEFSLDSKKSLDFKKEFKFSDSGVEMKIPVNLGKSWIKKQPVPGYERLDSYLLSSLELSDGNLIASFSHPQRESSFRIVYSKRDSRSSLAVEYSEPNHRVAVSSEPSLNKYLESDSLSAQMEQLWLSAQDLENYKSGLTKLTLGDENVIQSGLYLQFFGAVCKVIAPKVSALINKGYPDFDKKFARDKIASLGENARTMLSILNLT